MIADLDPETVDVLDALFEGVASATGFDAERLRTVKVRGDRDERWARDVACHVALEAGQAAPTVAAYMERSAGSVRRAGKLVAALMAHPSYNTADECDVAARALSAALDELGEQAWVSGSP